MRSGLKIISKKQKLKSKVKFILLISILLSIFIGLFVIFFTNIFKIKSVRVSIDDEIGIFSAESKTDLENLVLNKNILFFPEGKIKDYLKDKYQNIQNITFSRQFDKTLSIKVKLYEVKYVGCVSEDGFLIPCMYADINGLFFKEIDLDLKSENLQNDIKQKVKDKNLYYIEVSPQTLSLIDTKSKINNQEIDSISGTRLYTEEEMYTLMQFIKWIEKMSYLVDKIEAKNLKIVNIKTNSLIFKLSLEKGFAQTVKDYENLSNQDFFKKIEKNKLEYIDLSYKNKIFYKEFQDFIETNLKSSSTISTSSNTIN